MTEDDLRGALAEYRAGLEAELSILEQLAAVAARQHEVSTRRDYERLTVEGEQRDRLTGALVALEDGLQPVRRRLADERDRAAAQPGYLEIVTLRQRAAATVTHILSTDEASLQSLADAELARRAAVAGLVQGESTLAGYRRVLSPATTPAALINRRG
jgi:hypothetical protein